MNGNGVRWVELNEETKAQLERASKAADVIKALWEGDIQPHTEAKRMEEIWAGTDARKGGQQVQA